MENVPKVIVIAKDGNVTRAFANADVTVDVLDYDNKNLCIPGSEEAQYYEHLEQELDKPGYKMVF